jgi:hypothetical protein
MVIMRVEWPKGKEDPEEETVKTTEPEERRQLPTGPASFTQVHHDFRFIPNSQSHSRLFLPTSSFSKNVELKFH